MFSETDDSFCIHKDLSGLRNPASVIGQETGSCWVKINKPCSLFIGSVTSSGPITEPHLLASETFCLALTVGFPLRLTQGR